MSDIELTIQGAIATVYLNRADKRNAISFQMLKDLHRTAQNLKSDRSIRVVILAARGSSFSSGIDLSDLNNPKNRRFAGWELIKPGKSLFQKAFLVWQDLPIPVIAVINGHCFGAGTQLALAADFRIAHPESTLSIMESRWGLVPDMGLTRTLAGLIAIDHAKLLTYTARSITGEQALTYGLVTQTSTDPMQQAQALALELLQRSPDALAAAKDVLQTMITQPKRSLRLEKIWQLKLIIGKNSALARKKDKDPDTQFLPRQYK